MATVVVDFAPLTQRLSTLQERQLPYATSRALNETAKQVQLGVRTGMQQRFHIRRPWVLQQIKIEKEAFSTKKNLKSVVIGTSPEGKFLDKFEQGGVKKPYQGGHLAVPVDVPRTATGAVPQKYWYAGSGAKDAFTTIGGATRGPNGVFIITNERGQRLAFKRKRRGKGQQGPSQHGRDPNLTLWYVIEQAVPVPAILEFVKTGEAITAKVFAYNFRYWMAEAIRTAR